jgi:dimeric dUTPase (all-alpha-NTP-PPase superfamily)
LHVPITTVMPRQTRKKSSTGLYHVMLRGINRQDIFEEKEDYLHFLKSMSLVVDSKDHKGTPYRTVSPTSIKPF